MKIAFFNLNCIPRDRLLSRKIVTVYGGLCPAVTPVWSPPLLRKGSYMNLLTECTQHVLHLWPPLLSFPFLLLILITLRARWLRFWIQIKVRLTAISSLISSQTLAILFWMYLFSFEIGGNQGVCRIYAYDRQINQAVSNNENILFSQMNLRFYSTLFRLLLFFFFLVRLSFVDTWEG